MKINQLRAIATVLNATVTDRRKITSLVAGIRNYSATITAGKEKEAVAKLKSAIILATDYNADQAFILNLKSQVKALKAFFVIVRFDGFNIPYAHTTGTIRYQGVSYKFLCYMKAPSLANPARAIDPTFDNSVAPAVKVELRAIVTASLIKTWNRHRAAITGIKVA